MPVVEDRAASRLVFAFLNWSVELSIMGHGAERFQLGGRHRGLKVSADVI